MSKTIGKKKSIHGAPQASVVSYSVKVQVRCVMVLALLQTTIDGTYLP